MASLKNQLPLILILLVIMSDLDTTVTVTPWRGQILVRYCSSGIYHYYSVTVHTDHELVDLLNTLSVNDRYIELIHIITREGTIDQLPPMQWTPHIIKLTLREFPDITCLPVVNGLDDLSITNCPKINLTGLDGHIRYITLEDMSYIPNLQLTECLVGLSCSNCHFGYILPPSENHFERFAEHVVSMFKYRNCVFEHYSHPLFIHSFHHPFNISYDHIVSVKRLIQIVERQHVPWTFGLLRDASYRHRHTQETHPTSPSSETVSDITMASSLGNNVLRNAFEFISR